MAKNLIGKLLSKGSTPAKGKGSTPAKGSAEERAAEAAGHAEMARFAVESESTGGEVGHRHSKAVRSAWGLRNKSRDDPYSDLD
ncbi:hypothetical protein ACFXAF_31555 [Kitasatospora sp. NPDC059463]|uniref:hypothetical protein n=1 Tax=unclassified Kitasatospora TaxID=2633591 RepID=UPI0036BEECDB